MTQRPRSADARTRLAISQACVSRCALETSGPSSPPLAWNYSRRSEEEECGAGFNDAYMCDEDLNVLFRHRVWPYNNGTSAFPNIPVTGCDVER